MKEKPTLIDKMKEYFLEDLKEKSKKIKDVLAEIKNSKKVESARYFFKGLSIGLSMVYAVPTALRRGMEGFYNDDLHTSFVEEGMSYGILVSVVQGGVTTVGLAHTAYRLFTGQPVKGFLELNPVTFPLYTNAASLGCEVVRELVSVYRRAKESLKNPTSEESIDELVE